MGNTLRKDNRPHLPNQVFGITCSVERRAVMFYVIRKPVYVCHKILLCIINEYEFDKTFHRLL